MGKCFLRGHPRKPEQDFITAFSAKFCAISTEKLLQKITSNGKCLFKPPNCLSLITNS